MGVFDRNVVKYINYTEPKYTWGQKADGTWYCKEFKSETIVEGDRDIQLVNEVLNKYNKKDPVEVGIEEKPKKKKEDRKN